jgi:hypothetical protein
VIRQLEVRELLAHDEVGVHDLFLLDQAAAATARAK